MKKQIDLQLLAIFGGGLLFNFLFWNEGLALNLLLYSLFIMIALFSTKENRLNRKTILIGITHLLASLLVIYNHSDLNITTYYISLLVFVGFAHANLIRSFFTAFLVGLLQILTSPINLIKKLMKVKIGNYSLKPILKPIKYIILPIFVLLLFSIVYSIANPVFANYIRIFATHFFDTLYNIFTFFFGDLGIVHFLHIILGILFTAGILLAFTANSLEKLELKATENLIRKRKNKLLPSFGFEVKSIFFGGSISKKMGLKTENIIGIISFVALNLLLFFLNAIDFYTFWLGKIDYLVVNDYAAQLHEGTNALILSIFMAMAVILYFFNGNLNFFSKNKTIKILAFLWILQNAFLVCSVLLRDYNYIAMHGLTYKRIGVVVFLLLCTIGLITVYIKVAKKKTFFYLCKANGLIWYVLLFVFGFVNWDVFIANYNIANRKNSSLDLDHLTEMSDKVLPLLDKNSAILNIYVKKSSYANSYNTVTDSTTVTTNAMAVNDSLAAVVVPIDTAKLEKENEERAIVAFKADLNNRIIKFKEEQQEKSWLSWNYRDWQTSKYLLSKK